MSWEANKDFIVSQVEGGGGTQSMVNWYTRWVSSGQPTTKAGMKSQATLDAEAAQAAAQEAAQAAAEAAAASAPPSTSSSNAGNMFDFLNKVTDSSRGDTTTAGPTSSDMAAEAEANRIRAAEIARREAEAEEARLAEIQRQQAAAEEAARLAQEQADEQAAAEAEAERQRLAEEAAQAERNLAIQREREAEVARQAEEARQEAEQRAIAEQERVAAEAAEQARQEALAIEASEAAAEAAAQAAAQRAAEAEAARQAEAARKRAEELAERQAAEQARQEAQAQAEAAAAEAQAQAEAAAAALEQAEADAAMDVEVEAEVAFKPEEPQLSQWEQNKNFIIEQVEAGTADQGMQEWYERWQYSGSPEAKDSMLTITQYENKKRYDEYQAQQQADHEAAQEAQAALDLDRPDGVSRYLWEKVKNGSLDYNLTSVINQPEVRDAIIEAGYGDYVKAVHEQAMDNRAAHYQGNGASAQNAWNNAQYDWYTDNYGSYSNATATDSSANDLGFGGGSEVINEDYVNTAIQDALAAAQAQAEAAQAAADQAAADAAAANAADQAAADAAAAQAQAEADAAAAAQAEAQAQAQAEADTAAAAQAEAQAQAQAEADAAAAEQAAVEKEQYLQSVNQGMQVGIHGSNPGENPWGTPNAGGQGMFGQAYGQAKSAQPQQRVQQAPMQQQVPTQQQAPMQQQAPQYTPFADAYMKAKTTAEQPNAVTSMFNKELFN